MKAQHLKMNKCPLCTQIFRSYFELNQHMEAHFHKCEECGKTFTNKETLMRHMNKHHGGEESEEEVENSSNEEGSEEENTSKDDGSEEESQSESEDEESDSGDSFTYDDVRAILRYHQYQHSD